MFGRDDPRTRWLRHRSTVMDHHQRRMWVPRPPLVPRVALLVVLVVIALLAVVVTTGAVGAQGTLEPDPERHAAACPDASVVWEDTTTGTLETDLFETNTNRFVISYARLDLEKGDRMTPSFATVQDEQGRDVSSGKIPGPTPGGPLMEHVKPNEGRYVVDAVPGSYQISIDPGAWTKGYAVKIEECGTA